MTGTQGQAAARIDAGLRATLSGYSSEASRDTGVGECTPRSFEASTVRYCAVLRVAQPALRRLDSAVAGLDDGYRTLPASMSRMTRQAAAAVMPAVSYCGATSTTSNAV